MTKELSGSTTRRRRRERNPSRCTECGFLARQTSTSDKQRLILLTGAGASVPAGLATMKTIVDGIHGAQVPIDNRDPGAEVAKDTWKVISGIKGPDKATLEDLLARLQLYAETAELIKSDHVFSDELKAPLPHVISGQFKVRWETALAFCFRLMLDNYGPHKVQVAGDGFATLHKAFRLLLRLNKGTLHLFTTNYDCLLNVMASQLPDITFYSHINNENGHFESQWFIMNPKTYQEGSPRLYIHRLHGSIAWFHEPRSPYGIHEVFGAGEHLSIEDPKKLNQMAIKLVSDEKVGVRPAFSLAFQEFCSALEGCQQLLVWGHGFKDLALLRCMINVQRNRRQKYGISYLDPYLSENDVRENIQATISGEPDLSASVLSPQRLPWVTSDGYTGLLDTIQDMLQKPLRKGVRR